MFFSKSKCISGIRLIKGNNVKEILLLKFIFYKMVKVKICQFNIHIINFDVTDLDFYRKKCDLKIEIT